MKDLNLTKPFVFLVFGSIVIGVLPFLIAPHANNGFINAITTKPGGLFYVAAVFLALIAVTKLFPNKFKFNEMEEVEVSPFLKKIISTYLIIFVILTLGILVLILSKVVQ